MSTIASHSRLLNVRGLDVCISSPMSRT